jgi:endonuclease/exonuclease/phosphatase family metal-dependent hydrolase
MRKLLLWIFIFGFVAARAQDTLTVLQYNLLNYGNYTSYCTQSNNDYHTKDGYIATIVHYINPDIFTVNEITSNTDIQNHLLDYALNTDGVTRYSKANFIRDKYSYLVNALYYNHKKLGLAGHTIAQSYVRDVDVYKLYYKSSTLSSGDTVFVYCVVAHLKAGSTSSDASDRKTMADNTMKYLTTHNPDANYLFMGDFNVHSSSDAAYQSLTTNTTVPFNDPINKPGSWNNNPDFAMYQTQSTHGSQTNSCASYGGMDDRFDFILISDNIKNNSKKVQYIPETYHAVGQDGLHFNKSITDSPTDTKVPADVLNALYNNSDHLPVTLKLKLDVTTGINPWNESAFDQVRFTNPVSNQVNFTVHVNHEAKLSVEIYSLLGQSELKKQFTLDRGWQHFNMNISSLPKGLYIVRFTEKDKHISYSQKLIKQ